MAEIVYPRAYGVAELNYYLKHYLEEDSFLSSIAVAGELSGFKAHSSGHCYFALREGTHSLRAVMFRRYAETLAWQPRDGDMAIAVGAVSLYERDGSCQLYVQALLPAGAGRQAQDQEELRRRLEEEGLFAPERKKPLPAYALSVGVITSGEGAAWADIQRIAFQRFPGVKLTLYPALVQGAQAAADIAAAIAKGDRGRHEVLIVGRGGGAEADLEAFNSEAVVRAIAGAQTPVISAVGHESDFTLADLAADIRAATPTHGAALAVPELTELLEQLDERERRLHAALQKEADRAAESLGRSRERMDAAMAAILRREQRRLAEAAGRLELLSPLATLARGYSAVLDKEGRAVMDAMELQPGDALLIYPARGEIRAQVRETTAGGLAERD